MASTYSANLKIELIGTGEQSGTWGSTTNTNLGTALEEAIVGRATATFATDADLTLTLTNTNATQIARAFALRLESSVSLTATRNLIVPAINKPYIINNQTTGGQSIVVKNATGSGVTIPNGKRVAVYNNGVDVLTTIDYFPTLDIGGAATLSGGTANGVLYLNGSKAVSSGSGLVFDGSSLGLGVTPSAWHSNWKVYQASRDASFGGTDGGVVYSFMGSNVVATDASSPATTTWRYKLSSYAALYEQYSGIHRWVTAIPGTAGNPISFTQAMTLDANGNLGLGVTPSAWHSSYKAAQLGGASVFGISGAAVAAVASNGYINNSTIWTYSSSAAAGYYSIEGNNHKWFTAPSGTAGNPISFTQAMTLDASGNLGIGTSSPGYKLEVNGRIAAKSSSDVNLAFVLNNTASGGREWQMIGSATGGLDGGGTFNLRDNTAGANRLTVDSSGNLGIGVTPSAWGGSNKAIDIGSIGGVSADAATMRATNNVYSDSGGTFRYKTTAAALLYGQNPSVGHFWNIAPSGTAGNPITFTQAMTLDASGDLLVGKTSTGIDITGLQFRKDINALGITTASSDIEAIVVTRTANTGGLIGFYYTTGLTSVGSITTNGTSTAYNTSSDYRLKNITGPVQNSGAYIDSLNPVEGTWKADGSTFVGLIAHEVQEVSRTQVATGEKDGEQMQAMDYSNSELIANLIAEVQALRKRVAQLEAR